MQYRAASHRKLIPQDLLPKRRVSVRTIQHAAEGSLNGYDRYRSRRARRSPRDRTKSFFGASRANVRWYLARDIVRSIGPDKVNQLRHAKFFGDSAGVEAHMLKHAEIIAPKFAAVRQALADDLAALGIAEWTDPKGGYFVSLDLVPGRPRGSSNWPKPSASRSHPPAQRIPMATTPMTQICESHRPCHRWRKSSGP